MTYRSAIPADIDQIMPLAVALWPKQTTQYLRRTFDDIIKSDRETAFVAEESGQIIGFATVSLRRDYVEGSHSSPVGYLEGIYVLLEYRKRGIAKDLVQQAEQWTKNQGCTEMGSDLYLDNAASLQFHLSLGYHEAGRAIHMIKKI